MDVLDIVGAAERKLVWTDTYNLTVLEFETNNISTARREVSCMKMPVIPSRARLATICGGIQ